MSFELFRKIVDDIESMVVRHGNKVKILHLYKDGEPLLNEMLAPMILYAKTRAVAEQVSTTTNGILLTKERAMQLLDSGLDHVRVSVPSGPQYDIVKENCKALFREKVRRNSPLTVHVKAIGNLMTETEKGKFKSDFGPISDSLNLDSLMGWSGSHGSDFLLGNEIEKGMDGKTKLHENMICPEPFCRMAINFNGQASACCVDWAMGTLYGDATNMTLDEIWNGDLLRILRLLQARGNRDRIVACNGCHFVKGIVPEANLDRYTDKLMRMYQ